MVLVGSVHLGPRVTRKSFSRSVTCVSSACSAKTVRGHQDFRSRNSCQMQGIHPSPRLFALHLQGPGAAELTLPGQVSIVFDGISLSFHCWLRVRLTDLGRMDAWPS